MLDHFFFNVSNGSCFDFLKNINHTIRPTTAKAGIRVKYQAVLTAVVSFFVDIVVVTGEVVTVGVGEVIRYTVVVEAVVVVTRVVVVVLLELLEPPVLVTVVVAGVVVVVVDVVVVV